MPRVRICAGGTRQRVSLPRSPRCPPAPLRELRGCTTGSLPRNCIASSIMISSTGWAATRRVRANERSEENQREYARGERAHLGREERGERGHPAREISRAGCSRGKACGMSCNPTWKSLPNELLSFASVFCPRHHFLCIWAGNLWPKGESLGVDCCGEA